MTNSKEEIKRIFGLLLENNIEFVILRSYEFLCDDTIDFTGEIDVLAPFSAYEQIRNLFYKEHYYCKHSLGHCAFTQFSSEHNVTFDFQFEHIRELNMPYSSYANNLNSIINVDKYPCLGKEGLLTHLLVHCLIVKGYFKISHRKKLKELLDSHSISEKAVNILARYFPQGVIIHIFNAIQSDRFNLLENRRRYYLILFLIKRPKQIIHLFKYIIYRLEHIFYYFPGKGAVVAFIGLDGVGKTTLCRKVEESLNRFGYKTRYVYMGRVRQHVLPLDTVAKKMGISQRKDKKTPDKLYLLARDIIYLLDMFLRYMLYIFPYKISNHMVICDRYFYDMYLDRHQTALSRWILVYLFPRADVLVFLQLSEQEIIRRKNEYDSQYRKFLLNRLNEVAGQFNPYRLIADNIQKNRLTVHELIQETLFIRTWSRKIIQTNQLQTHAIRFWLDNLIYPKCFPNTFYRNVLFPLFTVIFLSPVRNFLHWLYLDYRIFSVRFPYINDTLSRIIFSKYNTKTTLPRRYLYSFLCRGWKKELIFSFSDVNTKSLHMWKISTNQLGRERLMNEANVLAYLHTLDEYLSQTTPDILNKVTIGKKFLILESTVQDESLLMYLYQGSISLEELDNIFLRLREWLEVLHKRSYSKALNGSPILEKKFRDIFTIYLNRTSLTAKETREVFDSFNTINTVIKNSSLVIEHGDFQPSNIFYNVQSGKMHVVDWEFSVIKGLPLVDFLNILGISIMALSCNIYYARWFKDQSRHMFRQARVITPEVFRNIFYQHTELSDMIKQHVHAYCKQLDIDIHFLKFLFLFYVLRHNRQNKDILKIFLQNKQNILWTK